MADLPTGTVTFLFTDVEGSTRLWERQPAAMRAAVDRHLALLRAAVAANDGHVFRTVGDGLCAAFATAPEAVAAALQAQQALRVEPSGEVGPLRVRMALHTGAVEVQQGDYVGACLNRLGRLLAVAHGDQALLSQATADLVRETLPGDAGLRDLGEQRLRDLGQAEHVYQVLHPDLPADFPALQSLTALPNNLPLQLTSFVGREQELAETKKALETTRLLTLTGIGGCGKTRLALEIAADVLEQYPDGVWLVELAPLADPALAPATVATAIGVREQPGQSVQTTMLQALGNKRLLLLLDNCEHLLDACARLADALLHACPGIQILATSREALSIAGETSRRVPSLSLPAPDAIASPERLARCEAVRLFGERALAVQPAFAVTEQNAPAVAQLCTRLDGIPLALELAAARLRALSVEQVAARLDQCFRLLTGGSRTALPRQQTLRAAIDWSYDLLGEAERRLFRRLSVFVGGWTLEAAEAVCPGDGIAPDEVLDLLARLVGQSLVLAEEQEDGEQRYRLLETLRQYGNERLIASDEAVTARDGHAAFFVRVAEAVGGNLAGGDRRERLATLDAEHDNLHAALTWLVAVGNAGQAANLTVALSGYWRWRHWTEGQRTVEAILALPALAKATRVALLAIAENLALWRYDLAARRRYHEDGLALARELGERHLIAHFLVRLGASYQAQGDLATARRLCTEGLVICRELDDAAGTSGALFTLADVARDEGDFATARALYKEVLAYARSVGDLELAAWQLNWLGLIALADGDMPPAEGSLEEALEIWRTQDVVNFAVYIGLICLDLLRGERARARQWAQEYRDRWHQGEQAPSPARIFARGLQELGLGQPARALRLLASAQAAWQEAPSANLPVRLLLDRMLPIAREAVHAELGLEAAASAEAAGHAMTLDQARAFALADDADVAVGAP